MLMGSCAYPLPTPSGVGGNVAVPAPTPVEEEPIAIEPRLDVPEECVFAPAADRDLYNWRQRVGERLDALTGRLADCFETQAVANGHQLVFELRIDPAGAAFVELRGSHADVCPIRSCVEHELEVARWEPPPSATAAAGVIGTLTYYPLTSTRLVFEPGVVGPLPLAACVDAVAGAGEPVDRSAVEAALAARKDALRECFERGVRRHPGLAGTITTSLSVTETGSVAGVEILENTLPDCAVVQCVRGVLPDLTFPRRSGGAVTVVHPLTFESSRQLPPGPERNRFMPVQDQGPSGAPERLESGPQGDGAVLWEQGG